MLCKPLSCSWGVSRASDLLRAWNEDLSPFRISFMLLILDLYFYPQQIPVHAIRWIPCTFVLKMSGYIQSLWQGMAGDLGPFCFPGLSFALPGFVHCRKVLHDMINVAEYWVFRSQWILWQSIHHNQLLAWSVSHLPVKPNTQQHPKYCSRLHQTTFRDIVSL